MASSSPLLVAYHAVSRTWRSPLAVSPDILDAQMAYLRRRGYVGLTFVESELLRRQGALPERCVVVTFDDGYRSTLEGAEVLASHGYPGTVFVVTQFVESGLDLSWPGVDRERDDATSDGELRPLVWEDLDALIDRGWEIGSHTVTHPLLASLDTPELDRELSESRHMIERRLGQCRSIAYPFGRENARVAARAAAAGYVAACTLTGAPRADSTFLRPRVNPPRRSSGPRYRFEVSSAGQRLRGSAAAGLLSRMRGRRPWVPPYDA